MPPRRRVPTEGSHRTDHLLIKLAEELEREAEALEKSEKDTD